MLFNILEREVASIPILGPRAVLGVPAFWINTQKSKSNRHGELVVLGLLIVHPGHGLPCCSKGVIYCTWTHGEFCEPKYTQIYYACIINLANCFSGEKRDKQTPMPEDARRFPRKGACTFA